MVDKPTGRLVKMSRFFQTSLIEGGFRLKTKITRQLDLDMYIGRRIVALSKECAIITDNYGQKVFVVSGGTAKKILVEKSGKRRSVEELEEDMGVAFAYNKGFGMVYANRVYIWDDPREGSEKLVIAKPHKPDSDGNTMQPLAARQVPGSNDIVVLLSDYYSNGGRFFCKLRLDGTKARWLTKPRELNYKDFQGLIKTEGVDIIPGEY